MNLTQNESIPRAINLETDIVANKKPSTKKVSLKSDKKTNSKPKTTKPTTQDNASETAPSTETEVIDFSKLLPPKAVDLNRSNSKSVSLAGAKRVAYGEVIKSSSNVYFIQLAALFTQRANLNEFSQLSKYGSIYKVQQSSATKVKLGYFIDQYEAKEVLRQVKAQGHSDAFITYEALNTSKLELVTLSENTTTDYSNDYHNYDNSTSNSYKVRLASYEDPIWFDVTKINDIGVIEQWTKGEWTIFVMSGYKTLQEAELARVTAINRGFPEAAVVEDRNGVLTKVN